MIRNRATLAGNLVDASPAADTAPPLLALDAEVDLVSQGGCRTIPLQDFFTRCSQNNPSSRTNSSGQCALGAVKPNTGFAYYKLGLRKADAISVVSVAVRLEAEPDGRCRTARIALGSVAPRPLRALAAEESLRGQATKCGNHLPKPADWQLRPHPRFLTYALRLLPPADGCSARTAPAAAGGREIWKAG